jgi:hypothetical protein
MSVVALLDVNVLVALFDPDHIHHDLAHDWFREARRHGWATCPITENGLVRVLSHPSYGAGLTVKDVAGYLQTMKASGQHHFWPDEISVVDRRRFQTGLIAGSRQLTDVYLLGLAAHHRARLATFDRAIPINAVKDARPAHLLVIAGSG